jgi:ribosomal protein S15P/S13E
MRKKSEEKKEEILETKEKVSDIESLEKSVEKIKKHLLKNKHDYSTLRALSIKEAKLNKLKKYKGL